VAPAAQFASVGIQIDFDDRTAHIEGDYAGSSSGLRRQLPRDCKLGINAC